MEALGAAARRAVAAAEAEALAIGHDRIGTEHLLLGILADVVGAVRSALVPGSEAVVVEDAGHFLHLEQTAEVNARVLGFLTA